MIAYTFAPGNIVRLSRAWERRYVKWVGHRPAHSASTDRKVLAVDGEHVLTACPSDGSLWMHASNLVFVRKAG